MNRKYEVGEIALMREDLNRLVPQKDSETERRAEIEDQLRTHMANGTAPEELHWCARLAIANDE
jgi:hypothetical protein